MDDREDLLHEYNALSEIPLLELHFLSVKNDGVGIADRVSQHLFQSVLCALRTAEAGYYQLSSQTPWSRVWDRIHILPPECS